VQCAPPLFTQFGHHNNIWQCEQVTLPLMQLSSLSSYFTLKHCSHTLKDQVFHQYRNQVKLYFNLLQF
jgi:hypothetical protein